MENLVNILKSNHKKMSYNFWKNKKVFITGHTGFKGAWLTATLTEMGADVTGSTLSTPANSSLFEKLGLKEKVTHITSDITDRKNIIKVIKDVNPEIIFHMAAQPLVRYSYKNPLETFDTNVIGTLNVLEAARYCDNLRSMVVVTTDKCYRNNDTGDFFKEDDPLGGKDPYSASKAAAEIVTNSYYQSFLKERNVATAAARAGNVIGGGDWAEDRLIPDIIRAYIDKQPVLIRNPNATRPWQFVLEPLRGYMMLAENLYENGDKFSGGWNFGPEPDGIQPVGKIVEILKQVIDFDLKVDKTPQPVEAALLALNIEKSKSKLNWKPKLRFDEAVTWTGSWYKNFAEGKSVKDITMDQIKEYFEI